EGVMRGRVGVSGRQLAPAGSAARPMLEIHGRRRGAPGATSQSSSQLCSPWGSILRPPRWSSLPSKALGLTMPLSLLARDRPEARAILRRVRSPVPRAGRLLMYACGPRISEAATLEITAIDGPNGLVRVIGTGNKERWVPLPQSVLAELRRLWKTHRNPRWLCPSRDGKRPITRAG